MAANPDLAQRLLPSNVQDLYNACYVGRALLARKAALAPNSDVGQTYAALDAALRKFNAWAELASGIDHRAIQTPQPEKIGTEKAAVLGSVSH